MPFARRLLAALVDRVLHAYSFQTFAVGEVLLASKMNQVEVNIRDHVHGSAGVGSSASSWTVTGLLDISAGTAGQISFPATQNASAGANVFDDYEEGTWTPLLAFGGASTGWGFSSGGNAQYRKLGSLVHIQTGISVNTKGSATGICSLTGIPFSVNTAGAGAALNNWSQMLTTFVHIAVVAIQSSSTANIFGAASALATLVSLTDAAFQVNSTIGFGFTYTTS